jgi:hypothetical protein
MSYGNRTFQDNLRGKHSSKSKRWLKRVNARIRRREERRDPASARVKDRFFQWAD